MTLGTQQVCNLVLFVYALEVKKVLGRKRFAKIPRPQVWIFHLDEPPLLRQNACTHLLPRTLIQTPRNLLPRSEVSTWQSQQQCSRLPLRCSDVRFRNANYN